MTEHRHPNIQTCPLAHLLSNRERPARFITFRHDDDAGSFAPSLPLHQPSAKRLNVCRFFGH
jgi:hypothetical protein